MSEIEPIKNFISELLSRKIPDEEEYMVEVIKLKKPSIIKRQIEIKNSAKSHVDYFANQVKNSKGIAYNKIYKSDAPVFQRINYFFKSNELNSDIYTKEFIDWWFVTKAPMEKMTTPQNMLKSLNIYYQDYVIPRLEKGQISREQNPDVSLYEELEAAYTDGKALQMFANYGIPVTLTYLVKVKNISENKILLLLKNKLKEMESSNIDELEKVYRSSIINSPYPDWFLLLNWRDCFNVSCFNKEAWWRNADYKGEYLSKYNALKL